jgi:heme-degrading monooxygenase HmoA
MTASPAVSTAPNRVSTSAFDGSRLRVVLMLDIHDGAQQEFLDAYERMCDAVASVKGHLSDQLCQSIENPSQWLITSEWESAPPFLAWVNSEEHIETVKPLHSCVRDTRSMRYSVLRETTHDGSGIRVETLQAAPRVGDGVVRHALTFTVRPGSEPEVARHLSEYASPSPQVDEKTRLRRTSLFMHGNRIVRAVEVEGDLMAALRHVSRQPEVRAVEEAINPYLEQERDMSDPQSARIFFTRAALPAVHHVAAGPEADSAHREGLFLPARPGRGMRLAQLLAEQDQRAADDPRSPVLGAALYQRDDIVVRVVDVAGDPDAEPAAVLGLTEPSVRAEALRLLDTAALDAPQDLGDDRALAELLARARMRPLTDRTSEPR